MTILPSYVEASKLAGDASVAIHRAISLLRQAVDKIQAEQRRFAYPTPAEPWAVAYRNAVDELESAQERIAALTRDQIQAAAASEKQIEHA